MDLLLELLFTAIVGVVPLSFGVLGGMALGLPLILIKICLGVFQKNGGWSLSLRPRSLSTSAPQGPRSLIRLISQPTTAPQMGGKDP